MAAEHGIECRDVPGADLLGAGQRQGVTGAQGIRRIELCVCGSGTISATRTPVST